MSGGLLTVALNRDGPQTPWGFRLHGGKDIGYPMVIQRVFLGSPSDGDLHRGDQLLQVQGHDTGQMSHQEAFNLIKAAGTRLQLLIRRIPGAPQTPLSPLAREVHPFAKLLRETEALPRAPLFQPMSPPRVTPQPQPLPYTPIKDYCYSPLPTTPLPDIAPVRGFFAPTPKNQADSELLDYYQEKAKEKRAIFQQGYRTLPLIAPGPKTRHDIPVGSYLRFTPNADWKGRPHVVQPSAKPMTFNKYPSPTYSTIGIDSRRSQRGGVLSFERPLDQNSQLVHHQYNSPLFLYSQRNIEQTITEQTGVPPTKAKLNVNAPLPSNQSGPPSPGNLAPARPGTKLANIVDITLSPTFQLLQEEEKRSSSPQPTPQDRPRTPATMRKTAPSAPKPFFADQQINSLGSPRETIHQSGSFKALMSTLYEPVEVQQA